jgi:putative endonuclease
MLFKAYPYHVYIVKCNDGSFYTGITSSLERRLQQHNGERWGGAKYTRNKRPVELVYVEKYENRSDAARREFEIKNTLSHVEKQALIDVATKEDILKAI